MGEFSQFAASVRAQVEGRAAPWLDERVSEARTRGPDVEAVADALRQLVLRGGKRLRAVVLASAFEACDGQGGPAAIAHVGVALELLQAYLLVHDDWIDGDDLRRGGPSVPALMRARFAGGRADAMSVLAGDLASAWALRAFLEAPFPPGRLVPASRELARMGAEVVEGQILDVAAAARNLREVEAVHALKTASYSVRGPVVIGARLAGAPDDCVAELAAFAEPLGVAFQLRDDVLGVFGDEGATGKPAGSDLRSGKRTALVVEALRDARAAAVLDRVLSHADAADADVRAAVDAIAACGARARVEARIGELVAEARAALDRARLTDRGGRLLALCADVLTEREK